MRAVLSTEVGRKALLLGNEAVVRGALEAGVGLVTGYPGTPASEIGDTFAALHQERGIAFEYSVNEKVALELAFGAALTGVRTLTSMKHLGLTFAGDPLSTMPYIGVVGGMVIVSAADPGCLTSPNEQDQRHFARMAGLPTLDPATPDEARRMTAFAFELSEKTELPVLLRLTTRVCHTRAPVTLGQLAEPRRQGAFRKNPKRFLPTPANARALRLELERRLWRAERLLEASGFNQVREPERPSGPRPAPGLRRGLVATGAPRNAVRVALERTGAALPLLEVGAVFPLPSGKVVDFLRRFDEVLVVEELSSWLEDGLLALAHEAGLAVRIRGKRDAMMQGPFELELEEVERRVRQFVGEAVPEPRAERRGAAVPPRPPVLCAGCLHRNVFFAAAAVFGPDATYVNDIGCYTLGANEPHRAGDVLVAMGSSVPLASGIARSTGQRVVAFLGDSTFFHSGIPGLVNAIEQKDDVVVVILDNHVTAMTGFQENPTSPGGSQAGRIPQVVRALGVEDVAVVDAADVAAAVRALERAKVARGVSVVVAEGPCAQVALKQADQKPAAAPQVEASRCHTCGMAEAGLYCELPPSAKAQKRVAVQRVDGAAAPAGQVPRTSPCSVECPLGICIPAYVGAIAAGEPERALQAVELRAALPSVCSHLCHRPCEDACVRGEGGAPIAVNALKKHLTDTVPRRTEAREAPEGPPVAIVGAGPAGLAAARELARRGYAPTLFDAHERPGGMLEYAVPDYRLPRAVLRADIEAVLAHGVEFKGGQKLGRDFTLEELHAEFSAVLLALGAQRSAVPDVAGAGLQGTGDALGFLAQPPPCAGEAVLVLGGGDVAIDVARTALRQGAASAVVACPEPREDLRAAFDAVQLALEEGVRLLPGKLVAGFTADEQGKVVAAQLAQVRDFRREGQAVFFAAGEAAERVAVGRVVLATGQRTELSGVALPAGAAREGGWLAADAYGRTKEPWLFAAGDAVTGPETVTAAMAAGVRAAWAIDSSLATGGREVPPCAAPLPREAARRHHPRRARSDVALSPAQARAEAERCLLCGMCKNCETCVELLACPAIVRDGGAPRIVASLCVGCGACVQACPNQAISVRAGPEAKA